MQTFKKITSLQSYVIWTVETMGTASQKRVNVIQDGQENSVTSNNAIQGVTSMVSVKMAHVFV